MFLQARCVSRRMLAAHSRFPENGPGPGRLQNTHRVIYRDGVEDKVPETETFSKQC